MIKELFEKIIKDYPFDIGGKIEENSVGKLVTKDLKETIDNCNLGNLYFIKGGVGQFGNFAEIPWLGIFDKEITNGAQKGYYLVYLFNKDKTGVYLSLNQGWTSYNSRYGADVNKKAVENTKTLKEELKSIMELPENFSFEGIELDAMSDMGRGYELTHICGKFYPTDKMPNDNI